MISLSDVTIPTPAAYDSNDPNQQRENYYYVINQIYSLAKTAGDDDPFGIRAALTESRPFVSADVGDVSIKLHGAETLIESP